jgi:hypothetical protein
MSAYAGFVFPEADGHRRISSKLGWLSDGVTITTRLARLTPLFTKAVMQATQEHRAQFREEAAQFALPIDWQL